MPTEIGSYYAVYEGIGSYLGTVEVWFEIVDGSDLSSASISLNTSHPKLIDGSINLVATVTDVAGNELVEGVHYELSYQTYDDSAQDWQDIYIQILNRGTKIHRTKRITYI